jgi:hypothetical protein
MSDKNLLAQAERKVFQASFEDGLIDIGIAGFTLMFAVAPLLSVPLGDFWASAVFLPFWGLLYLLLRWVRNRYVLPRIGTVTFGADRIARLKRGGVVMVVLNVIFLALGAFTFFYHEGPGWMIALRFSAIIVIFFSMAGYLYDYPLLFIYGVLCALAIPGGEWLWQQGYVSHHGYPVVWGALTAIIFLRGMVKFINLIRRGVPQFEEQANQGGV